MAYWLVKTEPSTYSFADLEHEKKTVWSGVKNAAALINLRAMKPGDEVMIYHTGNEKAVVGLGKVTKASPESGEPEIAAGKAVARPVTLAEIKQEKRLKEWGLVRIGRLSVVPTTAEAWGIVMKMSGNAQ